MGDLLLMLSVLAVLLSGFYMMKKIDDLIVEIREANRQQEQENRGKQNKQQNQKHESDQTCKNDPYDF